MKFLAFAAVALLFAGTTFAGDCGGGCGKKDGDKKDTVTTSVRL